MSECDSCGNKSKKAYARFINMLQGWGNYFWPNPKIEEMAQQRMRICSTCDQLTDDNRCNKCETKIKCPIIAKTRAPKESCPMGKWESKPLKL